MNERFDQESGSHLFSLDVAKVIGSCFGKWHFPWATGIPLAAGQESPPEKGLGEDHGSWLCPLLSTGTARGQVLTHSCQLTWEGSGNCPFTILVVELEKTLPPTQHEPCGEGTDSETVPVLPPSVRFNICFLLSFFSLLKELNKTIF